jgi:5-methylthioadenosine/S-adenosylhomocysteine deaminase
VGSLRLAADAVVTCDADFTVHRPGAVEIGADGRIASVGPADAGEQTRRGVLLPGLVNVHCHSPMTLFRGAAEDVPLDRFLREVLWPREARLQHGDVYWGMTLACAELLRFGVTTTCEMYVHEQAMLDAALAAHARCVLTPGVVDAPGWLPWRERLAQVLAFHDEHAGRHELVDVGLAPHSAYALPLEALDAVAAAACERDALVHIHVAETSEEGRALEAEHGVSVPALLAERGLLGGRTLAAHSVWLSDHDLALYRERDVAVAHCPQSNAKLASGIARVADMLRLGLRVGLGTDGPSSNNDLDLWEELRLAALLARVRDRDPEALPARDALLLATRGGAEALRRPDLGALAPGRRADVVFVRTDDPAFVPLVDERDLVSHLVWSASSRLVHDVWVAGRQVVAGGECLTVDFERAAYEVGERARRLARLA